MSTTTVPNDPVATAARTATEVLNDLGSDARAGLSTTQVTTLLAQVGPNAVRQHGARTLDVLIRQLRSPLLLLLIATAAVSFGLGERANASIIAVILACSVGLGFGNEYRAERAVRHLHAGIRHEALVTRQSQVQTVNVVDLVPGDLVHLSLGTIVPADLRLVDATHLQCDESVLTGESMPADKSTDPVASGTPLAETSSVAWMGTVVHAGSGTGVVVATGPRAQFGQIAAALGDRSPETDFQVGLRRFSVLLLQVAVVLTVVILVTNLLLRRPFIDSVLFSLAIAVGITPQLLPAVVSTSLATGSRQLARRKVLVKRLVCIEDLGDLDVLLTDKTGTLTQGAVGFLQAIGPGGDPVRDVVALGLHAADVTLVSDEPVGNDIDVALWRAATPAERPEAVRLGALAFDHDRQRASAVVRLHDGQVRLVVKGAPEPVLARCQDVPAEATATLERLYRDGLRVIAVASRDAGDLRTPTVHDETGLTLNGFLVFRDPPKASAGASLARLRRLGVEVKVATGDSAAVARRLCRDLGFDVDADGAVLTGPQLHDLDDDALRSAAEAGVVFARVTPEQKGRIVRALRRSGRAVGFLGDGVNDALALHQADIGISVDGAADVAKDAADVVLLEKSLDVLADGVAEGRLIFANTIKYVLMGTSSNFGNMFSAAAASGVLPFLPMLPSQLLLNNLLYDAGQLAIPTDRVDPEQLRRPSHWDIAFIRRFMVFFGPLSSLFDFLTFGVMLGPLSAGPQLFRSGWFVESLATQSLVIFAIRTRQVPFVRSRPSRPLVLATAAVVSAAVLVPVTPLADVLGFVAPPPLFYLALALMVAAYLVLVDVGKRWFFAMDRSGPPSRPRERGHPARVDRRAARFTVPRRPADRPGLAARVGPGTGRPM